MTSFRISGGMPKEQLMASLEVEFGERILVMPGSRIGTAEICRAMASNKYMLIAAFVVLRPLPWG